MAQQEPGDTTAVIPDFEVEAIARCLLPVLQAFYASSEGQVAFDQWKKARDDM